MEWLGFYLEHPLSVSSDFVETDNNTLFVQHHTESTAIQAYFSRSLARLFHDFHHISTMCKKATLKRHSSLPAHELGSAGHSKGEKWSPSHTNAAEAKADWWQTRVTTTQHKLGNYEGKIASMSWCLHEMKRKEAMELMASQKQSEPLAPLTHVRYSCMRKNGGLYRKSNMSNLWVLETSIKVNHSSWFQ